MFHSTNVPFDQCSFDEIAFNESTPTYLDIRSSIEFFVRALRRLLKQFETGTPLGRAKKTWLKMGTAAVAYIALLAPRLPWFLGGAAPATAGAGPQNPNFQSPTISQLSKIWTSSLPIEFFVRALRRSLKQFETGTPLGRAKKRGRKWARLLWHI